MSGGGFLPLRVRTKAVLAFEDSLQPSGFLAHEFRAPGSRKEFLEKRLTRFL